MPASLHIRRLTGCLVVLSTTVVSARGSEIRLKIRDGEVVTRSVESRPTGPTLYEVPSAPVVCGVTARAWYGEPVPGGGTLSPVTWANPPALNESGRIAFMAWVNGVNRNQGIFTADDAGLHSIVLGCGGGGGGGDPGTACGDPSPIGGTFSGFFGGTFFAPSMNSHGDILFVADVYQATAPRGLFLYRADSGQTIKIAAVGDASPLGGNFAEIGPGTINDDGTVVFLASGSYWGDIFQWKDGTITKVAAVGDPAPGGGSFSLLGTEKVGFTDGTFMPVGPVPDINAAGQVGFRGIVNGGIAERGLFLSSGGVHSWHVKAGDVTPAGGTYFDFYAPILNDRGDVAFFAEYGVSPVSSSIGWFAGSPGRWRKALSGLDPVDGGFAYGFGVSRNPMQPLAEDGRLLLWCDLDPNGGQERLVISNPDGSLDVVSRTGDPTPLGGQIGAMESYPSMRNARATLGSGTPGAPNGVLEAHFLIQAGMSEVTGVSVSTAASPPGGVAVAWDSQDALAGIGTGYDLVRGSLLALRTSGFPAGAVCAANGLPDTPYTEAAGSCPALLGDGCWYLIRSRNTCGTGTFGPPVMDAASPCP